MSARTIQALLLLTLAIVDDIGAIIVIAIFYTGGVETTALLVAFAIVALIAILVVLLFRPTGLFGKEVA